MPGHGCWHSWTTRSIPDPGPDRLPMSRARLDTAYRNTVYRVFPRGRADGAGSLDLRIGPADPGLTDLLCREGVRGGAFVTACNPGSQRVTDTANERAQQALARAVARAGLTSLSAVALDPEGNWPAEPGLVILGIGLDEALRLAARFGQNALVWLEAGRAPLLRWTDAAPEEDPRDTASR